MAKRSTQGSNLEPPDAEDLLRGIVVRRSAIEPADLVDLLKEGGGNRGEEFACGGWNLWGPSGVSADAAPGCGESTLASAERANSEKLAILGRERFQAG